MSDFSRDEQELLAGARRALGPSAADSARVLHKARLAIASGAVAAAETASVASGASALLVKKVLTWLAIATLAAWLGYGVGFELGERRAREASRGPTQTVAAGPAPQAPWLERPPSEPQAPSMPAVVVSPSSDAPAAQTTLSRRKAKLAPEPLLAPENDDAPVLAAPPPAPSASLDAEIKALRYVERALRNREPRNALARLAQLDREVPAGQMTEERVAARAMASCEERAQNGTSDRSAVMQRVLDFSQRYPASVYFERVRRICLATIDRDGATD
jgi:hypothetical protein